MLKSFCYVAAFAVAVFSTSCGNDENVIDAPSTDASVKTVYVGTTGELSKVYSRSSMNENHAALCFSDENSLEVFKRTLSSMNAAEKEELIKSYGVLSLHKLAKIADFELEEIGQEASSENDFRQKYEKYVEKYAGLLMRNYMDAEDLTLYVPDADSSESYIANDQGVYVVGDEVRNVNLTQKLSEKVEFFTMQHLNSKGGIAPLAAGEHNYANTSFKPNKKKETFVKVMVHEKIFTIEMSSRKKMWYGWKNDPHRHYYFTETITSPFTYTVNRAPLYVFNKNVSDGFGLRLGISQTGGVNGTIVAWNDLTSEHDADGKEIMEVVAGIEVPKCRYEHGCELKFGVFGSSK